MLKVPALYVCLYASTYLSIYLLIYGICMYVCIHVRKYVFIKLHITTQSGPVILVILCHSH